MSSESYLFVSYVWQDAVRVNEIVGMLGRLGIPIWLDTSELESDVNQQPVIEAAIRSSVGILVFLSSISVQSPVFKIELEVAAKRGAAIYPVLIENLPINEIPTYLARAQIANLADRDQKPAIWTVEFGRLATTLALKTKQGIKPLELKSHEVEQLASASVKQIQGRIQNRSTDAKDRVVSSKPYFFVSYALSDTGKVNEIVRMLAEYGIDTWQFSRNLKPGMNWTTAIEDAVRASVGILVFLSPGSVKSITILAELEAAAKTQAAIYPVLIENLPLNQLPPVLKHIQITNLSERDQKPSVWSSEFIKLTKILTERANQGIKPFEVLPREVEQIASASAEQIRGKVITPGTESAETPKSIFIVHGHDHTLRDEVEKYLIEIGVEPIILNKKENEQQTLLEKFFAWGKAARFAIVLVSSDDLGAGRFQYEAQGVGAKSLQFRARQNVILELGFFYGLLGMENVFVLQKKADKVFPNFERPSDLDGALFEVIDNTNQWKISLRERLKKEGFRLK